MIQIKSTETEKAEEVEDLILAEKDFSKQLEIYITHYNLVKNSRRLTTNGPQNIKIFCICNSCRKETDYENKLAIYNSYLISELKRITSMLDGFVDYKQKLIYYDKYLDIHGTYVFEDLDITMSIVPKGEYENRIFNKFQYERFLDSYFFKADSSLKDYYQLDFNSRRKVFIRKKQHSTYPDQSALKEIVLLNKHFNDHRNVKTSDLYNQLIEGITLDYTSVSWSFERCLEIVEANEGVKFLRYLENVNGISTSYTKSFHDSIQQSHEAYESYSVVTWKMVNGCIQEIKDKLYELSNDDSRIAYLKTTFLSFKIAGFEDYFKEVEEYLGDDIDVNAGFEAVGNVIKVTNSEKHSSLSEGIASVIKGRDSIVLEISEHLTDVYPLINFSEVMDAADYRTKSTFWIGSARFRNATKGFLKNFPDAEKSYNSGLDKIQKEYIREIR